LLNNYASSSENETTIGRLPTEAFVRIAAVVNGSAPNAKAAASKRKIVSANGGVES